MKKINAILSNSTKEQYPVLINKLSDIIEPFALHAVGLPPVYVGLKLSNLQLSRAERVFMYLALMVRMLPMLILRRQKHLCLEVKHSPSPLRMLSP